MGIPGFRSWLSKTFPTAFRQIRSGSENKFDHVLIDLNFILHSAARNSKTPDRALTFSYRMLDNVLSECRPLRTAMLAFDGPAPLAKIVTQRERRTLWARKLRRWMKKNPPLKPREPGPGEPPFTAEEAKVAQEEFEEEVLRVKKKKQWLQRVDPFLSVLLTPGTPLMSTIHKAVDFYACHRILTRKLFAGLRVIVSGPDSPGEGELKCFGRVIQMSERARATSGPGTRPSFCVVGNDADLILMALCSGVQNVFLLGERSREKESRSCIAVDMLFSDLDEIAPGYGASVALDLAFLSILQGNDYLPKLRYFVFKASWNAYVGMRRENPSRGLLLVVPPKDGEGAPSIQMDWDLFDKIVGSAAAAPAAGDVGPAVVSPRPAAAACVARASGEREEEEEEEEDVDEDVDEDELSAMSDPDVDDGAVGGRAARTPASLDFTEDAVRSFLTGITWTLDMYRSGACPDFMYAFASEPVTVADLVAIGRARFKVLPRARSSKKPLTPLECSMVLLPASCSRFVDSPLVELMSKGSASDVGHWYDNAPFYGLFSLQPLLDRVRAVIRTPGALPEHVVNRNSFGYDNMFMRTSVATKDALHELTYSKPMKLLVDPTPPAWLKDNTRLVFGNSLRRSVLTPWSFPVGKPELENTMLRWWSLFPAATPLKSRPLAGGTGEAVSHAAPLKSRPLAGGAGEAVSPAAGPAGAQPHEAPGGKHRQVHQQ